MDINDQNMVISGWSPSKPLQEFKSRDEYVPFIEFQNNETNIKFFKQENNTLSKQSNKKFKINEQ